MSALVSNEQAVARAFHRVGTDHVRHLRDGREALPAMLDAIDAAQREILLEMYWVADDIVGTRFRDHLIAKARAGVAVFVSYDGIGSLGVFRSFWTPLVEAGGRVLENGPVAPWRRRFRMSRLPYRDHRKLLVVDGDVGFCGGLNLALPWLPREEGGAEWRDDVVEIQGPAAGDLRVLVCETWHRLGHTGPRAQPGGVRARPRATSKQRRVWVLANRVPGLRKRRIHRTYLLAIRRARSSIDITSPYFLPGPLFLLALRQAHARGVRVRVLIPGVTDVRLVGYAMLGIVDTLVRDGVEVYAYNRSVLHAKTAVVDGHLVVMGSHNLDALSLRFDREANVVVDDRAFGADFVASFERDLTESSRVDSAAIRARSRLTRVFGWAAARFRAFL